MSVERLITEVMLVDKFSREMNQIARAQEEYSRQTAKMSLVGTGMVGAGMAMSKVAVDSIKTAASFDQQRQAFAGLLGDADKGKAMFDQLAQFTIKTPFQLQDWTQSTRVLLGWGMAAKDIMPALEGLGNSEAAMGRTGADMQKAAYELGEMGSGFLSMKQVRNLMMDGVPAAAMLKKELHLTGEELANIGNKHIDGKIGVQAILKGIQDPENHLSTGMEKQLGTLPGAVTSLKDNWNIFLDKMGTPALAPLTALTNQSSKMLSTLEGMDPATQKWVALLGYAAGPTLTASGAILKSVAAYREYTNIAKLAAAAGAIERAGEKSKVGIAGAEGDAVAGVTGKYGGLRGMLMKTGTAALGLGADTASTTAIMAAGLGTLGLYAAGLAGIVTIGWEITEMFQESNKAARDFEQSIAAVNKAKAQGYDLKKNAGQATGFSALPVWKQVGEEAFNDLVAPGFFDTTDSGSSALTDAHSRALAKKHGMAKNGVRARMIQEAKDQAAAAAQARREAAKAAAAAAGEAANKYELDPALGFKLKQDERHIELLKTMGGHEKELKAARAQEIADLNTAAGLLEKQARIATDAKKKYALLDEAADDRQKAKLLGLDKTAGDTQSKLDKYVAKIFGGGGLGEDDILKRTGVGRGYFAGMSGGKVPVSPLHAALATLKTRPLILNVHLGDKPFAQIKTEIKDDTIAEIVRVMEGSSMTKLYH